jgi:hypothetical protein
MNILNNQAMKNESFEWAAQVLKEPEKFRDWLGHQVFAKQDAVSCIAMLKAEYQAVGFFTQAHLLGSVVTDGFAHYNWLKGLYRQLYKVEPVKHETKSRYWDEVVENSDFSQFIDDNSLADLAAYGFHAKEMRLYRLWAICELTKNKGFYEHATINDTFTKVYCDELHHVSIFASITKPDAIEKTRKDHARGADALGLTP